MEKHKVIRYGAKHREGRERVEEPPQYKMFNNKRYEYHHWHWTKKGVLKEIAKLRDEGYSARAVIIDPGWATYKRERARLPKPTPIRSKPPRITPKRPKLRR